MLHTRLTLPFALLLAAAAVLAQPAAASATEAANLHVLIVADTQGQGANNFGFDLDIANMQRVVQESLAAQKMDGRYTIQVLQGADVKRARVFGYYKNLKATPNDALLFYFTGHGGIHPTRGHQMELRDGEIYKTELLEAMRRHNPRLSVILADCCSSIMGAGPLDPNVKYASLPGAEPTGAVSPVVPAEFKTTGAAFRDLFFKHTGVVDIMAAKSGTAASGNRKLGGSYFTVALANLLTKEGSRFDLNGNNFVEWNEMFSQLKQETVKVSTKGGQPHTPQAVSLGQTGGPQVVVNPRPVNPVNPVTPVVPKKKVQPSEFEGVAEGH